MPWKMAIFILFWSCTSAALRVAVDPGHGGSDHGAVYGKARETAIVLEIARKVQNFLKQNSVDVVLTRSKDEEIPLSERVKIAQEFGADLLVSIHANAAPDPRARGAEIFLVNTLPMNEETLFLAHQESQLSASQPPPQGSAEPSKKGDLAAIIEDLHRQSRIRQSLKATRLLAAEWKENRLPVQIKQAPFFVLNQAQVPSVLIEVGFLSNAQESARLMRTETQERIAAKIASALLKYASSVENFSSAQSARAR